MEMMNLLPGMDLPFCCAEVAFSQLAESAWLVSPLTSCFQSFDLKGQLLSGTRELGLSQECDSALATVSAQGSQLLSLHSWAQVSCSRSLLFFFSLQVCYFPQFKLAAALSCCF